MDKITHKMRHEYWERIITECNHSGMQKKDWMQLHNINPKSFYRWQKILRHEAATTLLSSEQDKFLELKAPDLPGMIKPFDECSVMIRKGNVSIEIDDSITDEFLSRIIRVMADA